MRISIDTLEILSETCDDAMDALSHVLRNFPCSARIVCDERCYYLAPEGRDDLWAAVPHRFR